ncbi:helix-turn-helix transcriptional regulator [Streptomyces sp. NPDC049916]|uniref:helix-turn-helix transcriptional regulator n=1 Tax=Streptomyces sp. NPDC049916 TaxID=3155156 RepID=UPI00342B78A9
MADVQKLDPSASPLDYFGSELRRVREAHGLKQGQLGSMMYCSGSPIGQIETIREASLRYAHLLATALSVEKSVARIRRVLEERYAARP